MNETTLASFRTRLEEIRSNMLGGVKGQYKAKRDGLNEQMADIADHAAQSYNRQLMMEFREQEWKKLRFVEDAIEKIDNGKYGICSECENPISEERLKVIPFTENCIDCLEAIEKKNGPT